MCFTNSLAGQLQQCSDGTTDHVRIKCQKISTEVQLTFVRYDGTQLGRSVGACR